MIKKISKILSCLVIISLFCAPSGAQAARTQSFLGIGYFTGLGDALSTIYYNSGPVDIGSMSFGVATLYVQGYSGSATSTFAVASSTGQKTFDVSYTGTTTMRQYQGFGTPTIATSTGAGTVAGTTTLASNSTDLAGSITLVTGSVPGANATITTFTSASSTLPFCVLQPMNLNTSQLQNASSTFMNQTATGFLIKSGSIGLISTTTYQWNYLCN